MYLTQLPQEQESQELEIIKNTLVYLFKVGAMLKDKRFHWFYKSNDSRYPWASPRTHDRLRKDLMFQANQLVRFNSGHQGNFASYLEDIGDLIKEYGAIAGELYDIETPAKDRKFTIPRDANHLHCFKELTHMLLSKDVNLKLADRINPSRAFYIRNFLDSLCTYLSARLTLSEPLGNTKFEKLLNGLTEKYVLAGYPHDILAYDADGIRSKRKGFAIMLRKEWCSTVWIESPKDEQLERPGYTTVYLK